MRGFVVAVLAGFASIFVACGSSYSSVTDAPDGGGDDAGVDASEPLEAGPNTDADAAAACPILYVSTGGNDLNTGCDQAKPKATINGALGYVKTLALANQEIHVCAGTYVENGLTLDYPVTLRGGYECSLWQRHTPFAWGGLDPTTGHAIFDATNETIIEAGTSAVALTVSGANVTSATAVEGFTIRGATPAAASIGTALVLENGSAALISNDHIVGPSSGPASRGLEVDDTAASEVMHCVIDGGSGGSALGTAAGSVGLIINTTGTGPSIHDNEIDSGNGMSSLAATVAVKVAGTTDLTGPRAFRNNAVFFGGSVATANVASYGIVTAPMSPVDLIGNGVYGGTINCTGTGICSAFAIYVQGTNSTIVGNRVYAGTISGTAEPPQLFAIDIDGGPTNVLVANNVVLYAPVALDNGIGITASHTTVSVQIVHNTIIIPSVSNTTQGIVAVGQSEHVDDNLIVGGRYGFVGVEGQCSDANGTDYPPLSLDNNAFVATVNVGAADAVSGTACGGAVAATTVPGFEALLPSVASSNVMLASSCTGTDTTCHVCTSPSCLEIFADPPTFATLVQGDARLAASVPCAIAKGGDANDTLVTTDLAGAPRTSPTTIGAFEDDGTCAP